MKGWYITGLLTRGNEEVHAVIIETDKVVAVNKFVWKMEALWKCGVSILTTTVVPIYGDKNNATNM